MFLFFYLTFWHRSFTFNSNKSPTRCNNFSVYYPEVCLQFNMFRAFPTHHQELNDCSGSLWFYLRIVVTVVLCSWSGRPAGRPDHERSTTVTTIRRSNQRLPLPVSELMMMGGKTPETRWAVNKHQDNKLENCCNCLVIYLNCTMMHGLTNLKNNLCSEHTHILHKISIFKENLRKDKNKYSQTQLNHEII